jgi:hypothetical protein
MVPVFDCAQGAGQQFHGRYGVQSAAVFGGAPRGAHCIDHDRMAHKYYR